VNAVLKPGFSIDDGGIPERYCQRATLASDRARRQGGSSRLKL